MFLRLRGMFGKCSCEFCFHKIWTQYINFLAAFTSMFFFLTLAGLDTLSAKMKQGFIFRGKSRTIRFTDDLPKNLYPKV